VVVVAVVVVVVGGGGVAVVVVAVVADDAIGSFRRLDLDSHFPQKNKVVVAAVAVVVAV
jgi:hypothetical protein